MRRLNSLPRSTDDTDAEVAAEDVLPRRLLKTPQDALGFKLLSHQSSPFGNIASRTSEAMSLLSQHAAKAFSTGLFLGSSSYRNLGDNQSAPPRGLNCGVFEGERVLAFVVTLWLVVVD